MRFYTFASILFAGLFCFVSETHAARVFWTENTDSEIRSDAPDGSDQQLLITTGSNGPLGLAVDPAGQRMYWANSGTASIRSSDLNGSAVSVRTLVSGIGGVHDLAVDSDNARLYWTNATRSEIRSIGLDGTGEQLLIATGSSTPLGIAVDLIGGRMYWADSGTNSIRSSDLIGSAASVQTLVSGLDGVHDVAVDAAGGRLYWTESAGNEIRRIDLDGTDEELLITTGSNAPRGLALDVAAGRMFWADSGTNSIFSSDLIGLASSITTVASGLGGVEDVALVPEPTTGLIALLGAAGTVCLRRRSSAVLL